MPWARASLNRELVLVFELGLQFCSKLSSNWSWWYMPLICALESKRQVDLS